MRSEALRASRPPNPPTADQPPIDAQLCPWQSSKRRKSDRTATYAVRRSGLTLRSSEVSKQAFQITIEQRIADGAIKVTLQYTTNDMVVKRRSWYRVPGQGKTLDMELADRMRANAMRTLDTWRREDTLPGF